MMGLWQRWVAWCTRPADNRPIAISRILMAVCVVVDLVVMGLRGSASEAFRLHELGGLSARVGPDYALSFLGPDQGMIIYAVVLVCFSCIALGIAVRPAIVVGVVFYAQLGMLFPPGDRAIDRIIRIMMLVLLFSDAHRCYALGNLIRGREAIRRTQAWVPFLFRFFLCIAYLSAGIHKVQTRGWFRFQGAPQLYRCIADPVTAHLNPDSPFWRSLWPVFRLFGVGAIVGELTAPLLLTRLAPWWGIFGATMHLMIAITMKLGMFSWGMLALYPVVFAPWLSPLLDKLEHRVGRSTVGGSPEPA